MMRKRLFGALLAAAMLVSFCAVPAGAVAPDSWDGSFDEPARKDGVYYIGTAEELAWFDHESTSVSQARAVELASASVRLTADIDLTGYEWIPICGRESASTLYGGTYGIPNVYCGGQYSGTFDGGGHTITGLSVVRTNPVTYINGANYDGDRMEAMGLFGYTSGAVIKDIGIRGSVTVRDFSYQVYNYLHVGGFVGMAQNQTSISGCFADLDMNVTIIAPTRICDNYVGGIAGSLTLASSVENCYSTGAIYAESSRALGIGGIAGATRSGRTVGDERLQCRIAKCWSDMDLTAGAANAGNAGGVTGWIGATSADDIPEISYSFALNDTLRGNGDADAGGTVYCGRVVGNGAAFSMSGEYNYGLEAMAFTDALIAPFAESDSGYRNSRGHDITAARARETSGRAFTDVYWNHGETVWDFSDADAYPRLAWEYAAAEAGTSYAVTVADSDHGAVSAPASAAEGSTVALTVTPDEGYELDTITAVYDGDAKAELSGSYKFVMPAADVTITATFKKIESGGGSGGEEPPALGDETVTIGTETKTSYFVPYGNYSTYSLCEIIYRADEIGGSGTIASVAFNVGQNADTSGTVYTAAGSVKVYMGHTDAGGFDDMTAFPDGLALVYSASTSRGTATGWETLALDTPFAYNGTDNLVVAVACENTTETSYLRYRYSDDGAYNSVMYRLNDEDSGYADITNTYFGESSSLSDVYAKAGTRPNIRLAFGSGGGEEPEAPTYKITVAAAERGSVSADRAAAKAGETVTLTVSPDGGYELFTLTVTDSGGNAVTVAGGAFTMPAADVTVTATFKPTVETPVFDGSGTAADPWRISSRDDWNRLAERVASGDADYNCKFYVQTADLDFTDAEFVMAGAAAVSTSASKLTSGAAFTGIYDGGGHRIILNLTKEAAPSLGTAGCYGLFGILGEGGVVKNLTVGGALAVTGTTSANVAVGAVAGYSWGTVQSCAVTADVSGTGASYGTMYAGGAVGRSYGSVKDCTVSGSVSGTLAGLEYPGSIRAGGVAGVVSGGSVTGCGFSGGVSVVPSAGKITYAGGIAGQIDNKDATVEDCAASGSVSGNYYAGGVAGDLSGIVRGNICDAVVSGGKYTGGVVGNIGTVNCVVTGNRFSGTFGADAANAGGIAGWLSTGKAAVRNNLYPWPGEPFGKSSAAATENAAVANSGGADLGFAAEFGDGTFSIAPGAATPALAVLSENDGTFERLAAVKDGDSWRYDISSGGTLVIAVAGDANGDGAVDTGDLAALRGALLGATETGVTEAGAAAADVSGNGTLDFLDLIALLQSIVNDGAFAW